MSNGRCQQDIVLNPPRPITDPVLSVQAPWAPALFGTKDRENRTWATDYRGRLWIHCGKRVDWNAPPEAWAAAGLTPPPVTSRFDRSAWTASLPLGMVLGSMVLAGCHHAVECREFGDWPACRMCSSWAMSDLYHWERIEPQRLREPVPCKGKLGLWKLPPEVEQQVRAQLEAAHA